LPFVAHSILMVAGAGCAAHARSRGEFARTREQLE
jgi:hypothetical protein